MRDPDFDLDDFLPYQFNIIAGRLSRGFAERYKARFGISIAEWRVVAHLHHSGAVSVREIHERAHMDKSKISRAAARLEAAGYISKRVSSVDRRLVELSLTQKGDAMMAELVVLARKYQAQIVELLGPDNAKVRDGINVLMHSRF
ncbi:MarR family winged helix-turn-helix transcriptional regulator [Tropicimonas sp. S265A]|uniref:MarR family winged helix-turn-helix transcriptional regulator n=1 Tax=Tropicimonas sp. S265A TaxID=3415134 RepID=UPI003C7AA25C